ncbi:MAG: MoaD/ThiS family protein [Deltaproteobacteria bacterium]|nr:MoaD/ThiS family protein [Deltaproteobacteria bacterium]
MAHIKFVGFLRDIIKKQQVEVYLKDPKKVRDLLPSVLPEDNIIVLINQKGATLDSIVENDDKVLILPVISGG